MPRLELFLNELNQLWLITCRKKEKKMQILPQFIKINTYLNTTLTSSAAVSMPAHESRPR